MNDNWDFLISEFRRLGGIADNVCQREGKYGRGIFPINSSLPARIFTPSQLLVKKEDIYLEENKLRIKKDKEYNQEVRNFFNFYQDNFSWGSGGKEQTELFERGLSSFNSNLKELVKVNVLVDLEKRHKGKWDEVIKNQFLNARAVNFRTIAVIAPIWDLVNHKVKSLPFIISKEGLSTPNYPALRSEIRHSYNNLSTLNRFFSYGFFSEETIVFSFPFTINIENLGINIFCRGMGLKDDSIKIERSGNKITIEGLPISDVNQPRLPYDYFDALLRKIGNTNIPQNFLFKIFQLNIEIRKKIICECNSIDNEFAKMLSQIIEYEIRLISSHNLDYMTH